MKPSYFKTQTSKVKLPVFFPDATRGVVKTVDSADIASTKTPGLLVNTYHLYKDLGEESIKTFGGIKNFMSWRGFVISDSGGFQVMSIVKSKNRGRITNEGVVFYENKNKKVILTPEKSIYYQMLLKTDMVVVLDDFTKPDATYKEAEDSIRRTINWAKRSKKEFIRLCDKNGLSKNKRPYLLGIVQGSDYIDLRKMCIEQLITIGFDGLGYGGWPLTKDGTFNYKIAHLIAKNTPENYFLYGLGIGKPEDIIQCVDLGYHIFDCVLPTRDARHRRLYVFNSNSIEKIDVRKPQFYSYYIPDKIKYYKDTGSISQYCDCLLCKNYSRAYLTHLFKIKDVTALRLATIHNLRFFSILMSKLK